MKQEELFKEWVSVPVTSTNGFKGQITIPGPFHNFEDLLYTVERIEACKNKHNQSRTDQIDLVKLGYALEVPMTLWSGDKITCQ